MVGGEGGGGGTLRRIGTTAVKRDWEEGGGGFVRGNREMVN